MSLAKEIELKKNWIKRWSRGAQWFRFQVRGRDSLSHISIPCATWTAKVAWPLRAVIKKWPLFSAAIRQHSSRGNFLAFELIGKWKEDASVRPSVRTRLEGLERESAARIMQSGPRASKLVWERWDAISSSGTWESLLLLCIVSRHHLQL